jgi:hypothetical protein
MKQIYLSIVMLFVAAISFAQQPVITAIVDATCSGGTPKLIEIYANGTVDFTQFTLEKSANGGAFGAGFDLSGFGTRTDAFIYVYAGTETTLNAEFPNIAATDYLSSNTANNNGDDAIRLIETTSMNVVDTYGTMIDGSGETWEYMDSHANRVNGTGPDATFNQANWTTAAPDTLDNQCGTSTFEVIIGAGSYTTTMITSPILAITAPANGSTVTGNVTVSFSVSNFTVANTGGDGYVQYQLDAAAFVDKFDTTDISFTSLAAASYTVTLQLVDQSGTVLNPAVTQSVTFTIPGAQQVQDLAGLRAINLPTSDVITVAGEVFVTHTEGFRNQKWIQDTSAGVLIDDDAGVITTSIARGDGITGVTGTLSEFNGLLQFSPTTDTGAATSTGNMPTPQAVTLAMLTANAEDYESELVQIIGLTFDNADGVIAFTNGSEEPVSTGTDTFVHRSLFNTDYIGLPLPTTATDLIGFITQRANGYSVQARNSSDVSTLSTDVVAMYTFNIYPNPNNGNTVHITSSNGEAVNVVIYSTLGQQVLAAKALTNELNVSNLNAGMYIVRISQGNATQTRKLIIK